MLLKRIDEIGVVRASEMSNTGYVFSKTGSSQFQTRGENSEQPEEVELVEEEERLWTKCFVAPMD